MLDIHYIAGFVDGEGSFGAILRRDCKHGRKWWCVVSNNHLPVLKEIQKVLGGRIYDRAPASPCHASSYRLVLAGRKQVRAVMLRLRPHLVVKRPLVERLLRLPIPERNKRGRCRIPGCFRRHLSRGLCSMHWQRERIGQRAAGTWIPAKAWSIRKTFKA